MRLIDADVLAEKLQFKRISAADWKFRGFDTRDLETVVRATATFDAFKDAGNLLDETPTVYPMEHVQGGKWKPEGKFACRCSCCGRAINSRLAASYKYCPNCGARMEG